ncbi:head GIN domain-containing protein [Niabella hirudinis]|uniref:head GIN domain-containing protein n=1 Tax=Niabella hirudinis TaxID=1285929 RepID=UPI003EBB799E
MKQVLFLFSMALLLAAVQGCKKVYPDGPAVRETRSVTAFDKIETALSGHVEYTTGADTKVEVLAADNLQRYVIIKVVNGKLVVRTPDNVTIKKGSVTVYVTTPALTAVTLTGNGNFTAIDAITSGSMDLKLTGSGNITLAKLSAVSLKAQLSGNGDININAGQNESQDVTATGSGNYDAHRMLSNETKIKLTGSGDVRVWAKDRLNVTITGSGDVRYAGTPVVSASITGSGTVKGL